MEVTISPSGLRRGMVTYESVILPIPDTEQVPFPLVVNSREGETGDGVSMLDSSNASELCMLSKMAEEVWGIVSSVSLISSKRVWELVSDSEGDRCSGIVIDPLSTLFEGWGGVIKVEHTANVAARNSADPAIDAKMIIIFFFMFFVFLSLACFE